MSETSRPERSDMADQDLESAKSEEEQEVLRLELEEANKKGEEYLQLLQRVQADFSNFRRRTEQQRQDLMNQAKAEVFLSILPVVDDFARALQATPEECKETDWGQGIDLIARKLTGAMEQQGLSEVDAAGRPFNPWEHEAIDYAPSADHAEDEVIEVVRKGYKLGDRVIRPAQVRVAKAI